ncbi:MAG TPA: sigma-70 family RNA polymerase sigma factor [Phycisphaerae bacterium]|nr:sigma-70 family RNA polymerase sigma factor [Phycisphaerae bacterium]HRW55521.1 sigma-70 family RNA polymerase sigma factor [Phycisphaerae bacterium]
MSGDRQADVTQILDEMSDGDASAAQRLLPHVYEELRALAASFFQQQRSDHTLQPTALVHEAFLRMVRSDANWNSRRHFFDVAAMAMRQLLTDHARRKSAAKRGGPAPCVTLLDIDAAAPSENDVDLIALDEALTTLSHLDFRQSRIVELRFLAGLSVEETAEILNVSPRTVKLDWRMAKAWLRARLSGEAPRDA